MKILIFSQYFYPENFRVNTLSKELVALGHEVTVVTGYPQYPINEFYEGYGFDIPYEKKWNGVNIERFKVYPRGHNAFGLLRNCVTYVTAADRWVKKCTEKFDAVYVFGISPVTVGLPAVTYKKKFGVPVLFNLQDLWPENVHEVLGIRFPPLTWAINRVVDRIYKYSNRVLCSSNGFVNHLEKRGVDRSKLVFWPQFCSYPQLDEAKRPDVYTPDTFNIVFTGNIGDAQGLDLIIKAAKELKGEKIRWYLVGDGRARERLTKLAEEYGVSDDVIFVGRVSEEEANAYAHHADCAYLSFKDTELFNMTLPAKLQTYLACGAPILAAAGGESANVINTAKCGIATHADVDALVSAARKISSMSEDEINVMRRNSREYFEKNFDMDTLIGELVDLMSNN